MHLGYNITKINCSIMSNIKVKSRIRSGHTVSHSEMKVKRMFKANNQKFKFFSNILITNISVVCSCRTRKNIISYGGIDRYLIHYRKIDNAFKSLRNRIVRKIALTDSLKRKEN